MSEDLSPENSSDEEIDKKELSSASYVIQTFLKAVKASRIYLPNNPLHQRFIGEFKEKILDHLENYGDLRLDIDQFEIKYKNNQIYQNQDTKESLAFRLNSDGLKAITLLEGIEDDEITDFMDIVAQEGSFERDDDIVTQLWSANMPHIEYEAMDDSEIVDGDGISIKKTTPGDQQSAIKQAYQSTPPSPPEPTPMAIPQDVITLSEEELAWLERIRDLEEKRKPIDDVMNILTVVLSSLDDLNLFTEYATITTNLIRDLVHTGEADYSIGLIQFLSRLEQNPNRSEEHKAILAEAKKKLFTEEMINDLEVIVDQPDKITTAQLQTLLLLLGRDAIQPICTLLGVATEKEVRKTIIDCLVKLGKETPEQFFSHLTDSRWYLARNAVLILRLIGNPRAVQEVSHLISHSNVKVRKEVLLFLQAMPGEAPKDLIVKFMNDENSAMRSKAIAIINKATHKKALKPLINISKTKDFEKKDISERKVIYETIGKLGANEVVPMFREMLAAKFWLNKSKEREAVTYALSGLRMIKTKESLEALTAARDSKKGEIKDMIELSIRALIGKQPAKPS